MEPSRIFYCPAPSNLLMSVSHLQCLLLPVSPMRARVCECIIHVCMRGCACAPPELSLHPTACLPPPSPSPLRHRICQCTECATRALAILFEVAAVVCAVLQSHHQKLRCYIVVPLGMSYTHLLGFWASNWNTSFAAIHAGPKLCCKWRYEFIHWYSQLLMSQVRNSDLITKWACSPCVHIQLSY